MESGSGKNLIFQHEFKNMKIGDITIREVKMLDQYSGAFDNLIKRFKTPKSICGYIVSAIGPLVAQEASFMMSVDQVENLMAKLNSRSKMITEIEKPIEIIQSQRTQYLKDYGFEFKTKKKRDNYINDWVADYEISDYVKIIYSKLENILFLRYCSFEFPDLAAKVEHEEKRRQVEEIPFEGSRFIVESFYESRKMRTIEDIQIDERISGLKCYDKPLVFISTTLGHYVTFLACKILHDDGRIEDTVFLINSLAGNYLVYQEIIFAICQLAFPEGLTKL